MRLTLVHDSVGGSTGMGRVVGWMARTALAADVPLTLIASEVDPDIERGARMVRLPMLAPIPSPLGQTAWGMLARRAIRAHATGTVHVHRPTLLRQADIMTCHHLARAAYVRGVRRGGTGFHRVMRDAQDLMIRGQDDYLYRNRTQAHLHFVSHLLRDEFRALYGERSVDTVLAPPAPPFRPVPPRERALSRARYGVRGNGIVVGYLGGLDYRKGFAAVKALAGCSDLELLIGGPHTDDLKVPFAHVVGYVDPERFLAACDVLIAPSLFDAANLVVLQAMARGIPVVVSDAVGYAADIRAANAGIVCGPADDLSTAVRAAAELAPASCARLVTGLSEEHQSNGLLELWSACEGATARR